jgi:hypothetical protein
MLSSSNASQKLSIPYFISFMISYSIVLFKEVIQLFFPMGVCYAPKCHAVSLMRVLYPHRSPVSSPKFGIGQYSIPGHDLG